MDMRLNEDGTYNGEIVYRAPISSNHAWSAGNDSDSYRVERVYSGGASPIPSPAMTDGWIYQVGNDFGEDGAYRTSVVGVQANVLDTGWIQTQDANGLNLKRIWVNKTLDDSKSIIQNITNLNTLYRADWNIQASRFVGRWNGSVVLQEAKVDDTGDEPPRYVKYNLTTEEGTYEIYTRITRFRTTAQDHIYGNKKATHGGITAGIKWSRGKFIATKIS